MEFRNVGRSGLVVSLTGLGCNNFGSRTDEEQSAAVVHTALDMGITHFDTADVYGGTHSEEILGKALVGHRDDVVVATKVGLSMEPGPYRGGASRRWLVRGCEASLQRLGTDWIDLYYLHRPDAGVPWEETMDALDDLVHAGKVRYIGASGMRGWQVAEAEHVARAAGSERFVCMQEEWSLITRGVESEVVPACRHYGIGLVPHTPLGWGMLTGKYRTGEPIPEGTRLSIPQFGRKLTEENFRKVDVLRRVADEAGRPLLELALAWLATQPEVSSVIAGARSVEQLRANAAALEKRLSADELAAIDTALGDLG
jgi:aryl-alcohol dehydrogenase-like predicted oxidoreductase